MKRYFETGKLKRIWIDKYCWGNWNICVRYKLEEGGKYHPDWMLPDGSINEELREL